MITYATYNTKSCTPYITYNRVQLLPLLTMLILILFIPIP